MNGVLFTAQLLVCWLSKANDQRLDTDLVERLDAEVLLPIACHLITNFRDEALGAELLNSGVSVNTRGNQI